MTKPFEQWTVLPHGKLSRVTDDILTVVGELHMPIGEFPRRMTVVRLGDRRLVIYSAIALEEAEMLALEGFGKPAFLVVPNDIHRLDARTWKDRYPDITVLAPPGVRAKVEEVVPVNATAADFGDPDVSFFTVPGTDGQEAALLVRAASGSTLVVNDLIWNMSDKPGFGGWVRHALGLTGPEPKIPLVAKMHSIKDKGALRAQLDAWGHIPDLQRIIVSHGDIVTREPAKVLTHLAESLAA